MPEMRQAEPIDSTPPLGPSDLGPVTVAMFREALRRALRDMRRAPGFALVFGLPWVMGGWFMIWLTWVTGQSYWLVFAAIGFPLIAPFAAVGFYDVSRRLEEGRPLDWKQIFSVIGRQSKRQLPSICAVILVVFLFWFFIAHMIFALFLGLSTMTNVSSSFDVFLTPNGLAMLAVGTTVGAGFAVLLYMITVLALPMLLDREIDFVTAMIHSFQYVQREPLRMFAWAAFIGATTFLAMVPGFLGLLIVLPLLGHATWHLYDMLAYGTGRGVASPEAPASSR
ncbi:putative membrane protein [Sagittula marina]|uniref:Putative membrane protein n=1 Tax=Sagittula marina TaxID=943940 RepID=A0A7W6DMD6_9RHOB|nr:putative membrane protein [Sagittula marina]